MSITFDAATAAAVIRNQGKLIDILSDDAKQLKSSTAFCANLQNRVTELTGENASLRAKLADAEATIKLLKTVSPPVPYALETKQEKKEAARTDDLVTCFICEETTRLSEIPLPDRWVSGGMHVCPKCREDAAIGKGERTGEA